MADRGTIQVTVIGTTDVGRVRDHNEDNLLVVDLTADERAESGQSIIRELGSRGFLVAVADGMGGAASGELASELAIETVRTKVKERGFTEGDVEVPEIAAGLSEALSAANEVIYSKSEAEVEHRGMGTTMTAAILLGEDLAIAQVGDSRAYLMRKGKLVQVTKDQSLIGQLIEDGTLTEEEAEKLGGRNIILQALGVEAGVSVETKTLEILEGDVLVLCSDGLSGMVKDAEMERTILESDDLRVACARLITMANDAGGKDNITVILAEFRGEGLRSPMKPLEEEGETGRSAGSVASFAPPPPPSAESSSSKWPPIALAGVVLLVLLFWLLRGGSADVTFTFPAAGGRATLTSTEGGDPIAIEPPAGEIEVRIDGIEPGTYLLEAELPHYEDLAIEVELTRGEYRRNVALRPEPGRLLLRSEIAGITVRVVELAPPEGEEPVVKQSPFLSRREITLEGVPAGELSIEQSREGFEPRSQTITMPPEGGGKGVAYPVDLEPMQEVKGVVHLNLDPRFAGAMVKVTDDYGEPVFEQRIPEGGSLTAEMRIGTHDLEITKAGYKPETSSIRIQKGENTPFDRLALQPLGRTLIVLGPPDAWVFVKLDGELQRRDQVKENGRLEVEGLLPGTYEVTLRPADGEKSTEMVTIQETDQTKTVEFSR